ncbi:MAG TPA: fumarylacetoacetate hydrolase family protein [Beijerinckiaceae bacterium]|nr:fumarylacetoacetate hydrolase family protein [Beijerinckiaceae bacterium]
MDRGEELAQRLVEARRAGRRIELDPALAPADEDAAMAVQAAVVRRLGERVGGWKVTIANGSPIAAPLFASLVGENGTSRPFHEALAGLEVEVAVRLSRDVAPGAGRDAVLSAVDQVLVGIEIVESRWRDRTGVPFPANLADNLANGYYVAGARRGPEALGALAALHCRLTLDDEVLFDGPAAHGNGDPLAPLLAYAAAPYDRLGGFAAGQIVTTGTLCGLVPVSRPGRVRAALSGLGEASLELS